MTDVNNPNIVNEGGEVWPEGDLPSQGFGARETLMPGTDEFTLPANIAQLWGTVDIKDGNPRSKTHGQTVRRNQLKFDKNNPLVIASGPHAGQTMTASFSSNPRPRGKADDEKTPWVSDLAYLLDIGIGDHSRPATPDGLKAAINKYAGRTIRIEHGLSAHCRPDKVRYIIVATPPPAGSPVGTPSSEKTIADPTGVKGCGDDSQKRADGKGKKGRWYTNDFKDPETGDFMDSIECECGAVLRGFPSVERFAPPLGTPTK